MMDKRYINYFTPLIQHFLREVEALPHPDIVAMPEPHLPLFGKSYENAKPRLVIIGRDTLKWGDLRDFITDEKADPGCKLRAGLEEFRDYSLFEHPTATASPQRFIGFMMMITAAMHGRDDWKMMKQGQMHEILDSFAWADAHAVARYDGVASKAKVPREYWEAVQRAGERFDLFSHIVETLKPDVALLLYRPADLRSYFQGLNYETVWQEGSLAHIRLPDVGVDFIHAPHPGFMSRKKVLVQYRSRILELFASLRMRMPFKALPASAETPPCCGTPSEPLLPATRSGEIMPTSPAQS